jgi:hypothetical protein
MTSAEFDQIVKPYTTRNPNNPGEPEGFIFWQKFATDLQTLADRRTHSDNFMARLAKIEAKERVEANLLKEYGVTAYDLKKTFRQLKEILLLRANSQSHLITFAFRNMDKDHSGRIGAPEIKKYLMQAQRGNETLNYKVIDCIVDLCDNDGDGEVDYAELSKSASLPERRGCTRSRTRHRTRHTRHVTQTSTRLVTRPRTSGRPTARRPRAPILASC